MRGKNMIASIAAIAVLAGSLQAGPPGVQTADGKITVTNGSTTLCLTATSLAENAPVIVLPCTGLATQSWNSSRYESYLIVAAAGDPRLCLGWLAKGGVSVVLVDCATEGTKGFPLGIFRGSGGAYVVTFLDKYKMTADIRTGRATWATKKSRWQEWEFLPWIAAK
jgi:hypothetical protein